MSLYPSKRLRPTCPATEASSPAASPLESSVAPSLRPSPPTKIDALPRALQSYVIAFLDQAGFAATTQISRAWLVVATLPTSVPAKLWLRRPSREIPAGVSAVIHRAATAPRSNFGGLRSLVMTRLEALHEAAIDGLAAAIRALPSLVALELGGGGPTLDALVHAIVDPPVDTGSARLVFPGVRILALGMHLWTAPFVDVARAFPALTHLSISPDYLSRNIPYSPSDSFATLGSRRQWQNWSALSLFAHLERLTLLSKNFHWHVDISDRELERDASDGVVVVDHDDDEKEEELLHAADPAAAGLRNRAGDRRPRQVPAFSTVAELEFVNWDGVSARPIFDLVRHLPRLARLTLRQCRFDSPLYPAPRRRDLIANLAELKIERTHDCNIAGGVDFALRHTDIAAVQVYRLLPPPPSLLGATESSAAAAAAATCNESTYPPAVTCTAVTRLHLNGDQEYPGAVVDDAALVAASRRPIAVHYHYDPDACRCNFASPPNISFVRHPNKRTS